MLKPWSYSPRLITDTILGSSSINNMAITR